MGEELGIIERAVSKYLTK